MTERKKNAIPKPTYLGGNLKLLRKLKGLSQTSLANDLGLTRNNIASYESGMVEPNAKVFLRICHYFDQVPKNMLEDTMGDNPLTSVVDISDNIGIIEEVLLDHIDRFITQTNDMAKILDGYKSLNELRQEEEGDMSNETLHNTFVDLLDLLENLLKSNWKLIGSISAIDSTKLTT